MKFNMSQEKVDNIKQQIKEKKEKEKKEKEKRKTL